MSALSVHIFRSASIRTVLSDDGQPLFVGKDICDVLGYTNHSKAMDDHCRGVTKRYPISDSLGRPQEVRVLAEPDVLRLIIKCSLPAAEEFERWVFEEVLPSIRKTGRYEAPGAEPAPADPVGYAFFLSPLAVRAAEAFGLTGNFAKLSANQAVLKTTGTNVLNLLGHEQIEAENQTGHHYTPTELGKEVGLSAVAFNKALAAGGLQVRVGSCWEPTAAASGLFVLLDTGKSHSNGTPVVQLKWYRSVLERVRLVA